MPQTRPTGDQLRFQSSKTGEHILDDYMEAVERGTRTLPNLLDDLWAPGDGQLRNNLWNLRVNPTTAELEQRIGDFSDPNTGWTPVANASFFNFRGAYATATAYLRLDLVIHNNEFLLCVNPHTSSGASPSGTNFRPLVSLEDAGVASFNGRTGAVLLTSGDVTSALTYTPTSPASLASAIAPLAPVNSPTFTGTPTLPSATRLSPFSSAIGGRLRFQKPSTGTTVGDVLVDIFGPSLRIYDNDDPIYPGFSLNLLTGDIFNTTKNANVSYVGHTHAISDIVNLQTTLNNKSNADHTHAYLPLTGGAITGNLTIQKAAPTVILDGANPLMRLQGSNTSTNTIIQLWGNMGGTSTLQTQISTAANSGNVTYSAAGHVFTDLAGTSTLASITTSGLTVLGRNVLTELDSKASTSHTHAISQITGLQSTLDGKQNNLGFTPIQQGGGAGQGTNKVYIGWTPGGTLALQIDSTNFGSTWPIGISGNAASASTVAWGGITGVPATFTPSAHVHTIANITGLQAALDGKQAAGSYAAASHTHTIANVTGLQAALDSKLNTAGGTIASLAVSGNAEIFGTPVIANSSPTMWWRDTDNRTFAIHVNGNLAYFMRGAANTTTWTDIGGRWPMLLDLETGDFSVAGRAFSQGLELGYRSLPLYNEVDPITANTAVRGAGYTTSSSVTIPAGTFARGDMFTIIANNPSTITIIQGGGLTLRLAGTTTTGNRTLSANGMATVVFLSANEALISGPGVS